MLIISFDAVGDSEFETLLKYPAFSGLVRQSAVFRDVSSVFLSNTYPIHTSVATGVTPDIHGIISNKQPFPSPHSLWVTGEDSIRAETIWQAAAKQGIQVAAVFWPVTAFSKTIRYNIPEVLAPPGKSQVMTSFRAGSKGLQIKMLLKYQKLLLENHRLAEGIYQPNLDNFAAACMADILRRYNPGLALMHLTAFDAHCHRYGKGSAELKTACEALDRNLAALLKAVGDTRQIILFSDHYQVDVHTDIDPNTVLVRRGLLHEEVSGPAVARKAGNGRRSTAGAGKAGRGYVPGESGCYVECCGGSAFFHAGTLEASQIAELRNMLEQSEGFRRFLTAAELRKAGFTDAAFGFCAKEGYCYEAFSSGHKGNHGYPLDMPDYKVFYLVRGAGWEKGRITRGGSLLDIAPLAARFLGITLGK